MPSSEQKSVVTVRLSETMKASLQRSADEKGGNLSAEILHRLTEYESQRDFIGRLLDDGVAISAAVGLETLRKGARTSPASSISDEKTAPLERAVVTAACVSKLFQTVADHAGHALAEKRATMLTEGWEKKIEAGDLANDFDIPATATKISVDLSNVARQEGEHMAAHMGAAIGPSIWDVCFNKDSPLRSAAPGMGHGLMQTLRGSYVGLPPSFMPPPQTEEDQLAFVAKMKEAGTIRNTAKHQISEGQHAGLSEDEVVDMLYDKLMTFDVDPNKAVPNAKAS
jgi:hypothetical protein